MLTKKIKVEFPLVVAVELVRLLERFMKVVVLSQKVKDKMGDTEASEKEKFHGGLLIMVQSIIIKELVTAGVMKKDALKAFGFDVDESIEHLDDFIKMEEVFEQLEDMDDDGNKAE